MKITWVLINCNSRGEADRIGRTLLEQRLVSCYDIFSRLKTSYFWPPRTGKIENAKGALLVVETLPKLVLKLRKVVTKLHSDTLPFIGSMPLEVAPEYERWVRGEVKS